MTPYTLGPLNPDGTRIMYVAGKEILIAPQSLPDDQWAIKLQAKADKFGAS